MSTTATPPAILTETGPEPDAPGPDPQRKPNLHTGFGPLLRRLHFYAGVFVAPFLFLVALTGFVYAFTPQIDQIAYHDQLHVIPTGGQPIALSQQVSAAQAVVPGGTLYAVHPAAAPDATTKVDFSLPELGDNQRTVYIDPYTGQIRGVLTTWFGSTPATTWLDRMHSNLNLGETGRLYSELAASWLWVLVLGGLILWWRHHRGARAARRLLLPQTQARQGVRRTRSWHAVTGVWIGAVLLFLSATGLTWSVYAGANFGAVRTALNSDSLPLDTSLDGTSASAAGDEHHSAGNANSNSDTADFDAIAASTAASGLSGPVTITPPEEPGQAWTIAQADNTWPVHLDKIAVHPVTGAVVDTVHWADQPLLSKLTTFGIQAHMGVLFGLPNQIALALVAAGLITILILGYRMWWQRRPTRDRGSRLGTPPARGTWRHTNFGLLFPLIAIATATGWAIPLLGWTLLGFLLLDALIGIYQHRTSPRHA